MNVDPLAPRTPYEVSPRQYSVSHQMATTAFELPNFRVTQTLGVVRGIVVRSRNVFANSWRHTATSRRRQHHDLDEDV
jgi:hypothetical protein